ncbi:MAG TPA: hypothetical protein VGM39_14515 [Kofleriaceae bacterium]|jgi:hypothetical protein
MRIPVWLVLGIAAVVMIFGVYRLRLAFRADPQDQAQKRGGFYGMRRRTHLLIGIVYMILAGGLAATAFGWNPFGKTIGPATKAPTKDKAPSQGIPFDKIPTPGK